MADNDDFGGGFGDDDFGGGFDEPAPPKPSPKASPKAKIKRGSKRASTRGMGLYAKSPQQRMAEAEAERALQEKIHAAKNPQPEAADDEFGGGDFGGGGEDEAPKTQASSGMNMWGSTPNAGVVIPPFVPRDQRNKNVWDVGSKKKRECDKALLAGGQGDFLIREMVTNRGSRHVLCVHDQGTVYEQYIRHVDEDFMFQSREFKTLADIIKHVQRNPLYNAKGMPLYIDHPCRM